MRVGMRAQLQRKCDCGGSGTCGPCMAKKPLMRRATGAAREEIPASVHQVLGSSGSAMDADTQAFGASSFGHDFSKVRVHHDGAAAESARQVNASAYTVGNHIVFGAGRYSPGSSAGRELMAHEMAHVVQQSAGSSGGLQAQAVEEISSPGDPAEKEADEAAAAALRR